ncbi:MAG: hypothetical protein IJP23_05390 [Oscillospiraceae bacterium]|nr:hypothetical protein [Oscillospiraceae bacterium]
MIKKILDKKLFYAIISIIIAIGFWIYVVNVENSETDITIKNIPVVYEGEESLRDNRSLVIGDEEKVEYMTLNFSGRRSDINKLNKNNMTINVDLTAIRTAGTYTLQYDVEFPNGVSSSDFDFSKNNGYITVALYKLTSKDVEVIGDFTGSIQEGYTSSGFEFSPATVKIFGTEKELAEVERALVTLNRTDLDETVQGTSDYILIDRDGEAVESLAITRETDEVSFVYGVLMEKEVVLDVSAIEGGGLTDKNTTFNVMPGKLTLVGDAAVLEELNTIYLPVDLAEVRNGDVLRLEIPLPNDVRNITGETQAKVTVKTVGVATQVVEITDIELKNLPADSEVELRTSSIKVELRGNSAEVAAITPENITAIADFALANGITGNITVPVEITVEGYENVGVLGTYEAVASVTEN